jgi:hypothetical protein
MLLLPALRWLAEWACSQNPGCEATGYKIKEAAVDLAARLRSSQTFPHLKLSLLQGIARPMQSIRFGD